MTATTVGIFGARVFDAELFLIDSDVTASSTLGLQALNRSTVLVQGGRFSNNGSAHLGTPGPLCGGCYLRPCRLGFDARGTNLEPAELPRRAERLRRQGKREEASDLARE